MNKLASLVGRWKIHRGRFSATQQNWWAISERRYNPLQVRFRSLIQFMTWENGHNTQQRFCRLLQIKFLSRCITIRLMRCIYNAERGIKQFTHEFVEAKCHFSRSVWVENSTFIVARHHSVWIAKVTSHLANRQHGHDAWRWMDSCSRTATRRKLTKQQLFHRFKHTSP